MSETRAVTSQADLDALPPDIIAVVTTDVHLTVRDNRTIHVEGSSQPYVVARGSSQPYVEARGSSQPYVVARGSSQPYVVARESSQPYVEARGSSQPYVEARESSQPRVVARESSQPRVVAWESSQPYVVAWESSQPYVVAWESSQPYVVAWESSQLQARGRVHVDASKFVAVTSTPEAVVRGGVHIVIPDLDTCDADVWCDYYGLPVEDGAVVVYKAVNDGLRSSHGATYPVGGTVSAPDWQAERQCGNGLHFGPSPAHARRYSMAATRFLACRVALDGLLPMGDKCKAESCLVLHEVDVDGQRVAKAEPVGASR